MAASGTRYGYLGLKNGRAFVLPTSGRVAAQVIDIYSAQTPKARLGKRLLTAALKLGAASYFLPPAPIADSDGNTALLDHLRAVLGQPALVFAISLGVPGPHRKPVMQALTPDGVPLAFIKIGWNAASNRLVQREADMLRLLQQLDLPAFVAPKVLHAGEWRGRFICAQTAPEQSTPPPLTFGPVHRDIVRALATHAATQQPLESSPFWQALQAAVARVPQRCYRDLLDSGMAQASTRLKSQTLPFHFCHGDFTPWNGKWMESRSTLWLYDWEYASTDRPAGWDILRFFVQTEYFVEKRSAGDISESLRANGRAGCALREHLQDLGADAQLSDWLALLYLLDQLAFYAAEDPAQTRTLRLLATLINLLMLTMKG